MSNSTKTDRTAWVKMGVLVTAVTLTAACQEGGVNPVAPSATTEPAAVAGAATTDATLTPEARDGGRVKVDIVEFSGSGWSGTCTVSRNGSDGRFKATGSGAGGTPLRVWFSVNDFPTAVAETTNNQGAFRTAWVSRSMQADDTLRCVIRDINGLALADTQGFPAP